MPSKHPLNTPYANARVLINGLVSALFPYIASILCVYRYFCLLEPPNEAMNNNARAMKHLCQEPSNAYFDEHVALVQYTLRTLFVS